MTPRSFCFFCLYYPGKITHLGSVEICKCHVTSKEFPALLEYFSNEEPEFFRNYPRHLGRLPLELHLFLRFHVQSATGLKLCSPMARAAYEYTDFFDTKILNFPISDSYLVTMSRFSSITTMQIALQKAKIRHHLLLDFSRICLETGVIDGNGPLFVVGAFASEGPAKESVFTKPGILILFMSQRFYAVGLTDYPTYVDIARMSNHLLARDNSGSSSFYICAGCPESMPSITPLFIYDWLLLFEYPERVKFLFPGIRYEGESRNVGRDLVYAPTVISAAALMSVIDDPGSLLDPSVIFSFFKTLYQGYSNRHKGANKHRCVLRKQLPQNYIPTNGRAISVEYAVFFPDPPENLVDSSDDEDDDPEILSNED